LYYVYAKTSQYGRAWRAAELPAYSTYAFPDDCRAVKTVLFARDAYVNPIKRIITAGSNGAALKITYYMRPQELTCANIADMNAAYEGVVAEDKANLFTEADRKKLILPIEWHWQILVNGATALCDTANYGDKTPQAVLEPYLKEFWAAMNTRPNDRREIVSAGNW
jgi:hypothetical protein